MNLLFVDAIDFPYGGAHSVQVGLLIKGMRENGARASLIIPYGRKRESITSNTKKYGKYKGIPYYFVRYDKNYRKAIRFLDIFIGVVKTSLLIRNRFKKGKLDSVILGGIVDIIRDSPIILVCNFYKIPIYFLLVEKASTSEEYYGIAGLLNYRSQVLTEKYIAKFATGIIVISSLLRKYYCKFLPETKVLLSPILVSESTHTDTDAEIIRKTITKLSDQYKGKRMILYSGTFGEKDGIYTMIDAFSEVVKEYPDTLFIMTGKPHNDLILKEITSAINSRSLADKIILVGFLDFHELVSYTNKADILLVCRSNSSFANYGFPWKLGEYCLTGKPIVATNVSDVSYYFRNDYSLYIVEPNSPSQIAEKIKYIFEHYEIALEVASRGKETALREFNYSEKGKELMSFIERNS